MDGRSPADLVPALAEPTQRVAPRWIGLLVLANLAVWMGFFTPIQVLLPEQIAAIDPAHKEAMLGWVTGLGALAAVVTSSMPSTTPSTWGIPTQPDTAPRWDTRWCPGRPPGACSSPRWCSR